MLTIDAELTMDMYGVDDADQSANTQPEPAVVEPSADQDVSAFDIETAPLDDDVLRAMMPPFVPLPHPGEFDPSSVKCGNLKDPLKIREKVDAAAAAHAAAVRDHDANCQRAATEAFDTFKDRAALDATTGRVVVVGVSMGSAPGYINCDGDGDAEAAGLRAFWCWVEQNLKFGRPMLGWNIHGFDIPMLVRRSWITSVPIPLGIRQGRNWNPLFVDLMQHWMLGGRDMLKLDTAAKAFGIAGKASGEFTLPSGEVVLVDGANFYKAWRRPECRKWAEDYLMQDLNLPRLLAIRMGIA